MEPDYIKNYEGIKQKFLSNFSECSLIQESDLEEVELKARIVYSLGRELLQDASNATEREISAIFKEIFSDLSISIFLSMCCIDNASRIVLRRVLDLGISIPVFWNNPDKFWGWKVIDSHETDLNFRENVDYLVGLSYREYLQNEFGISELLIKKSEVNSIYRDLSNTIHGKYISFETTFNDAYSFNKDDFNRTLKLILKCENLLLYCFKHRFVEAFTRVETKFSALERYNYEY
jgi:hypothetical protein